MGWNGSVWTSTDLLYSTFFVENMRGEEGGKISVRLVAAAKGDEIQGGGG